MLRLFADFNDMQDGVVAGLQRYVDGPRPLQRGDRVLVHDGDGNHCWGDVERVDGELVYVLLDAATWMAESDVGDQQVEAALRVGTSGPGEQGRQVAYYPKGGEAANTNTNPIGNPILRAVGAPVRRA